MNVNMISNLKPKRTKGQYTTQNILLAINSPVIVAGRGSSGKKYML